VPAYYTGDELANFDKFLVLPFNAQMWLQRWIEDNLVLLCREFNWVQDGLITPKQAAEAMSLAMKDLYYMPDPTGSIVAYALLPTNLPEGCIYCDGSSYTTTDYPVLFGKIGYSFGGSGANFNVPDLRSRAIIGVGQGTGLSDRTLGQSIGEENHTLNTTELPSHTHSIPATITSLAVEPGELPVLDPFIAPAFTGSAGGDGAHNNMQPSFALTYAIITGQ
jgi:microcystin-dependent protein